MVAVPESVVSEPVVAVAEAGSIAAAQRRVVAVAESPMELLRPESDLVAMLSPYGRVDLLVASEDPVQVSVRPIGKLGGQTTEPEPAESAAVDLDELDDELDDDPDESDGSDEDDVRSRVEGLGLSMLTVHRLGLRSLLQPSAEDDLVAALSELVGFDPEPGVSCLAPLPVSGQLGRAVVDRAVQRIAKVYALPLLRYRCLELAVVGE